MLSGVGIHVFCIDQNVAEYQNCNVIHTKTTELVKILSVMEI